MKLTEEQKSRLAALLAKAADTLTDAERVEFAGLKAIEAEAAQADGNDEATTVTEGELEAAVTKAVSKALEGKGVDTAAILDEVKKSGEGVKLADIEAAVAKHLDASKLDKDALVAEIKKSIPAAGVTKADLEASLETFSKGLRQESKHQFATFGGSFPVEHRSGNMSVAQKQLLNICLGKVSDEALERNGIKRPAGINDGIRESDLIRAKEVGARSIKSLRDSIAYGGKALTTGGAGNGAELIPSDLSSDLQMRMYLDSQLAAALIASEIDMPSDPFKLPLKTTRTQFYKGSEAPGSDPTSSNPGTGSITLDSTKMIGVAQYSYEADEDSIIAILPMLQEDMASGAAFTFEQAVLSGDATGAHQDSDIEAVAGHAAKSFNGVRALALANASTKIDLATGGISAANIAAMRKKMGVYGVRPRDLALVVGPRGYNDLVSLDETLTFDKVGNPDAARILSGVAASIYGIPIIVSDAVREDLNATGVYDGTTTTKGSVFLIHRPSWVVGVRRGFTVEVDVNRLQQVNYVIASFRRDFKAKESLATVPSAIVGYNFTA
jgi:HK97 family phage major capsid protein